MLKSYITTALRNLWRYRGYTLINILGLAIGLACVMLILLYVRSELSYDRFHENRDQIYLLTLQSTNPQNGVTSQRAIGPYRLADELKVDFPDLEQIIRIAPQGRETIEYQDQIYQENKLAFVDPEIFQVFTFPFSTGDPKKALEDPHSLVMTDAIAKKYFGNNNPIGQVVRIRNADFKVTGIMEEIPDQSQFKFDILVSMNSAPNVFSKIVLENWGEGYVLTLAMTKPNESPRDFAARLQDFTNVKLESWKAFSPAIIMHPLSSLYLNAGNLSGFAPGGDRTYVIAFSFIAGFILLIACINFMNLATARSAVRAREVGLRKVVGAGRSQLITQFLSESITLALICLVIALFIVKWTIPSFNQLADRSISFQFFDNFWLLAGFLGLAILAGILAGSYPALLLSGFSPVNVFSGNLSEGFKGASLRKVLVTFQFAISIFLIIVTGIVYLQIKYCRDLDIGFDKSHLLVINGTPLEMRARYDQLRSELLSNPQIENCAAASRVPPGRLSSSLRARPEGIPEDQQRGMQTVWTDYDFIETIGLELAAGRSFRRDFPADASTGFILNEAAVKEIGWTNEEAIDKTFGSSEIRDWENGQWENRDGKVIGVLKDFHFESLKQEIIPTVYFIAPYMAWNYVIRIKPGNIPSTLNFIEEKWKQFSPDTPFEYTFVDDNFEQLYRNEERQGKIFGVFSGLAIFIACLGLIGLASFTAERRKKEVGIRKVLGASGFNLIFLLTKEFTWLVLIAFILAVPVSWLIMKKWLQDFAYQVAVGPAVFIISGLFALLIAWLTVSTQTARAAFSNPAKVIRNE
jgi:putative ABC transport system permease protein